MRKSKFTDDQIAFALKQAELDITVDEVFRMMGISDATFYCLAQEIWQSRAARVALTAPIRGREPQAQADRGRPEFGQGDAAGG